MRVVVHYKNEDMLIVDAVQLYMNNNQVKIYQSQPYDVFIYDKIKIQMLYVDGVELINNK